MEHQENITLSAQNARTCASCGSPLKDEQIFCSHCGKKYEEPYVICQSCEQKMLAGQNFCPNCGAKYVVPDRKCESCGAVISDGEAFCGVCGASTDLGRRNKTGTALSLLKRIIPLLMSIFIVITCFLPIVKSTISKDTLGTNKDLRVSHSPIDLVVLSAASFIPIDEDDYEENTADLLEESSFLENKEGDDLSSRDVAKISRILKKLTLLATRYSAYDPFSIPLFVLGLICAVYIILAISLLSLSVADLISFLRKRRQKLSSRTFLLFISLFSAISFSVLAAYKISPLDSPSSHFVTKEVLCVSPILLMIFSAVISLLFALYRIFFERSYKMRIGEVIKRSLSSVFAIALLFFAMTPIFATTLNANFSGSDKKRESTAFIDAGGLEFLNTDKATSNKYGKFKETKELITSYIGAIEILYSAKEFRDSPATVNTLFRDVSIGLLKNKHPLFFSLAATFVILLSLCSALILSSNIAALATGENKKTAFLPTMKIILVFLALFILITSIGLSISTTSCADKMDIDYSVSVAYGVIVMIVLSVAVALTPSFSSKTSAPLNKYV